MVGSISTLCRVGREGSRILFFESSSPIGGKIFLSFLLLPHLLRVVLCIWYRELHFSNFLGKSRGGACISLSHSWWPTGVGGNRIFFGVGVGCASSMCHLTSDAGGWVGERRVRIIGDRSHAFGKLAHASHLSRVVSGVRERETAQGSL